MRPASSSPLHFIPFHLRHFRTHFKILSTDAQPVVSCWNQILDSAEGPVSFRYDEIGSRLKAYRLGSGLSADEIASQLGISRTALYRFEKGELAKIETLERLAELLGVSIPTLLGVGIEYIPSAVTYFERMRQIEETSEHLIVLSGPISFLLASDAFETILEEVLTENV